MEAEVQKGVVLDDSGDLVLEKLQMYLRYTSEGDSTELRDIWSVSLFKDKSGNTESKVLLMGMKYMGYTDLVYTILELLKILSLV